MNVPYLFSRMIPAVPRGAPWRCRLAALLLAGSMASFPAQAATESACKAPDGFGAPLPELSRLHAALESGERITIVVLAAPPAAKAGREPRDAQYSARLIQHLARYWKGSEMNLIEIDYEGQTAEQVAARLPDVLARHRPELLIWENGATDAARGTDVAEFARAVEEGIEAADRAGTTLVLMDPWYDERFPLWVAPQPYIDMLAQVVRGYPVLLFPLHELSRHWEEERQPGAAGGAPDSQESDCIAALLAGMLVAASN